jgi:uncharacterized protein (DUF433 family)
MSTPTVLAIETIVSDPAIRGGRPIIAGRAVSVADLVASHVHRGQTAEDLAVNFVLELGQVYAALAYYYQHKADVDAQMQADATEAERLLAALDAQGRLKKLDWANVLF